MTYTLEPELPATPTPKDYSRIHFDPSEVPATRIVGLLACQRDPLLRTLTRRVVSSQPAQAAPVAQKGRAKQKKSKSTPASATASASASGAATPAEPTVPEGKLWEVELEDTVLFPEGGGQPWDTGRMTLADANGTPHTFAIEGCVRRGLEAWHVVRVPDDSAVVFDSIVGQEATVEVDWDRRQDHMVTHTAQHLLSAVLDQRRLHTLSWGMPAYPSTDAPYVELPRGLTWQEAQEVEDECNAHIREGLRIWIDVDMQGSEDAEGRANRGIPKDYTGGVIRHCNITGVDRNACCGTQIPALSLINFLHVLPPSTPADASEPTSKVPTRLLFVAGPRAQRHLAQASRELSRAGQVINVGRADLAERLAKIEANRFDTAEREKALRIELTRLIGQATAAEARGQGRGKILRTAPATHDYDSLSGMAGAFCDARPDGVVVAVSTAASPALVVVQSKDQDLAKKTFDDLKAKLAGEDKARVKGGGARGRFMVKVESKWTKADGEAVDAALAA